MKRKGNYKPIITDTTKHEVIWINEQTEAKRRQNFQNEKSSYLFHTWKNSNNSLFIDAGKQNENT